MNPGFKGHTRSGTPENVPIPETDLPMIVSEPELPGIRRLMRARRRALSRPRQIAASRRVAAAVAKSATFHKARRIGFYVAADGEIDPSSLRQLACSLGKSAYLPRLHRLIDLRMDFAEFRPGDPLRRNRFGIAEPTRRARVLPAWRLDLVLVPLVAFDRQGNRLGMGGGFYDRAFARGRHGLRTRPPGLIGLAHRLQQVERLPARPWDVPLDAVFSDSPP